VGRGMLSPGPQDINEQDVHHSSVLVRLCSLISPRYEALDRRVQQAQAEAEQQRQVLEAELAKKVADHEATSSRLVQLEAQASGRWEGDDEPYQPFGREMSVEDDYVGFGGGGSDPTYEPFGGGSLDDIGDDEAPRTPMKVAQPVVDEEMVQERWTF